MGIREENTKKPDGARFVIRGYVSRTPEEVRMDGKDGKQVHFMRMEVTTERPGYKDGPAKKTVYPLDIFDRGLMADLNNAPLQIAQEVIVWGKLAARERKTKEGKFFTSVSLQALSLSTHVSQVGKIEI